VRAQRGKRAPSEDIVTHSLQVCPILQLDNYSQVFFRFMWEKLRIRERDQIMGYLFVFAFLSFIGFWLLALGLPGAAGVAAGFFVLAIAFATARAVRHWLEGKSARAPVGPLSADERCKARTKLLRGRMPRQNHPVAPTISFPPLP
jgi:hypothetical protein